MTSEEVQRHVLGQYGLVATAVELDELEAVISTAASMLMPTSKRRRPKMISKIMSLLFIFLWPRRTFLMM